MLDLSVQLDLRTFGERLFQEDAGRLQRREAVVAALKRVAEVSQAELSPFLDDLVRSGAVEGYRGLSVVNRLIVTASPGAIRELAARDEVAAIVEERAEVNPLLTTHSEVAGQVPRTSWALETMGVPATWRAGLDGRGIVVGIIDAGASARHEQLEENYRGGATSWLDPSGQRAEPFDVLAGHGTTVLSVAVGRNVAGRQVGVAPRARWIACAGIPGGRFNNVALADCADWMLNVGQPDVLINAWILPEPGCDRSFQRVVDAWRAAEIVPVFAAGNQGPAPATDRSPANYVGLYPGDGRALSVGGLATPDSLLPKSSRGPNSCDGSEYPALVAPAREISAALPLSKSTYIQSEGTSVAAGLVAGAVALLLQRYPEAAVTEIEAALTRSALDVGREGSENGFGHGLLYVPAALDSLGRFVGTNDTANRATETARHR